MADDQQAQPIAASVEQPEPMPSSQQSTPDVADENTGAVQQGVSPQELPQEASDRTRREFEKLKEQLREERQRREYLEQSFQSMTPQVQQQDVPQIYDPETGFVNESALTDLQKRTLTAEQRAVQAEESIKNFRREQENRETYATFPELNPDGKSFDQELHKETRKIILDSMLNPNDYGGNQLGFLDAAKLAKSELSKRIDAAKKEGAEEAITQLSPKEQAALNVESSTSGESREVEYETLRQQTRKGDLDAIVNRFKKASSQ